MPTHNHFRLSELHRQHTIITHKELGLCTLSESTWTRAIEFMWSLFKFMWSRRMHEWTRADGMRGIRKQISTVGFFRPLPRMSWRDSWRGPEAKQIDTLTKLGTTTWSKRCSAACISTCFPHEDVSAKKANALSNLNLQMLACGMVKWHRLYSQIVWSVGTVPAMSQWSRQQPQPVGWWRRSVVACG